MKYFQSHAKIFYVTISLVAVTMLIYVFVLHSNGTVPMLGGIYAADKARLEALVEKDGAKAAYDEFKQMNQEASNVSQHQSAHIFGEVLYEHEGLKGFSVCDSAFFFGCYHSFIGRAIADKGIVVLKQLDEACASAYGSAGLGCSHGIGHGVLSFYGYKPQDLNRSLNACGTLTWKHTFGGCQDGVFMEYNFRTMAKDGMSKTRDFSEATKYEPCTSVPDRFKADCYFNNPQWWVQTLSGKSDIAGIMSTYCDGVTDATNKRACYRGLGYALAPSSGFDAQKLLNTCISLRASKEKQLWCREGVAWMLYADPALRSHVPELCTSTGLTPDEVKQCAAEYLFVIS